MLLAIVTIANSELVCPGYGYIRPIQPCVNNCTVDGDCSYGQKCCYTPVTPCGYRCLQAKENKPKSGTCPPSQSDQNIMDWLLCDAHLCDVDGDCKCKKKCCPNKCGALVCISPEKKNSTKN